MDTVTTSFSTYSGPDFLLFYGALLIAAIIAGFWIPAFLRKDGQAHPVTDRLDLAWLAGGAARVTESVLARLLGSGAIGVADKKLRVVDSRTGSDFVENTILRLGGDFTLRDAHKSVKTYADDVDERLTNRGLLLERADRWTMRLAAVSPYLLVLGVGFYRRSAGLADGEDVGLLTLMMAAVAFFALLRFARFDVRTRAGQAALAEGQEAHARLRSAPTSPELGLGVALFGTGVLAGTPYSDLHTMRQSTSGGSDSGCSSGDSGCGGGCGGCGG